MIEQPTTVDPEIERALQRRLEALAADLSELVEELADEAGSERVGDQLRRVAFRANGALPKRRRRPTVKVEFVATRLCAACGVERERIDDLLAFTVAAQEHYDVVDDLIDGDVATGRETEAFVTSELLSPVLVRYLGRLGPEATEYWSSEALQTVESFVLELSRDAPSPAAYRELLAHQASLYGGVTGLCAIAADRRDLLPTFERLGRAFFTYEQLLLDGRQHHAGDPDPWNAWRISDSATVRRHLRCVEREYHRCLDAVPVEDPEFLRALVAVDLEAWERRLAEAASDDLDASRRA